VFPNDFGEKKSKNVKKRRDINPSDGIVKLHKGTLSNKKWTFSFSFEIN
jgi:hypothetical protein